MTKGLFITGTDTGVGKTWVTVALMRHFKNQGHTVIGMKPVASGCLEIDGKLRNEDALLLQQNASIPVQYEWVNPYAYRLPVSPHLAGVEHPPVLDDIRSIFQTLQQNADIVLVEGVGGWRVPLNADSDVSDLARVLGLPVIMVVAIRLGCINHARLTYESIVRSGQDCAGWIAVCSDNNMLLREENIATIQAMIDAPLLGVIPFMSEPDFDQMSSAFIKTL
ncbi:MAG: dethiobiotin synthase [Gammaproteobacteria bacterium HGW-Gammaproteobacteria-10]|nr:MAG: dethiobiotin synthase [Gammaproteobacteria bacterium HGW-Gammaproteobacteria-10]